VRSASARDAAPFLFPLPRDSPRFFPLTRLPRPQVVAVDFLFRLARNPDYSLSPPPYFCCLRFSSCFAWACHASYFQNREDNVPPPFFSFFPLLNTAGKDSRGDFFDVRPGPCLLTFSSPPEAPLGDPPFDRFKFLRFTLVID